jgi:peptide/nickel transport system substrate-binding protein
MKKEENMGNYLRKCQVQVLVFLGSFLFAMGLSTNPTIAETPKRGGSVTVAVANAPVGLDLHVGKLVSTLEHTEHIYETLVRWNYKMEVEPCLATSWEQPDDRTYIFHLRKGVKFHHGRELTSEDVVFSFERIRNPKGVALGRSIFKRIKAIEALDKYTVKMTLKETLPAFMQYLAYARYAAIVPKDVVLKHGSLQRVTSGTGPFKLKEYKHGTQATYIRNDDYWERGKPYLDGFKLVVASDDMSRLAGVRMGTYDIGWVQAPQLVAQAYKMPNIRIIPSKPTRQGRFFLNHLHPPFNNVKLRRAVSACLDRQAIIDKVLLGKGMFSSIIPAGYVPFGITTNEEISRLPYHKQDYDLAKKLLKEAGHPNGFEFTLITVTVRPDFVPACEIIQEQLSPVGIKAKIQIMEMGAVNKLRRSRDYQAMYRSLSWRPDPAATCADYFYGNKNEVGQGNPIIKRLIELCLTEMDHEKRLEYFKRLQWWAADDVTTIFPYAHAAYYEMVNKRVKGYHFPANNSRLYPGRGEVFPHGRVFFLLPPLRRR